MERASIWSLSVLRECVRGGESRETLFHGLRSGNIYVTLLVVGIYVTLLYISDKPTVGSEALCLALYGSKDGAIGHLESKVPSPAVTGQNIVMYML